MHYNSNCAMIRPRYEAATVQKIVFDEESAGGLGGSLTHSDSQGSAISGAANLMPWSAALFRSRKRQPLGSLN